MGSSAVMPLTNLENHIVLPCLSMSPTSDAADQSSGRIWTRDRGNPDGPILVADPDARQKPQAATA